MLPRCAVVVLTISVVCLSGCDRLAKLDAQTEEVVGLKKQVTQLQSLTEATIKDFSNIRIQMALTLTRINDLESARRKESPESQTLNRDQTQALEIAIASCVKVVRESAPTDSYAKKYWTEFDSYYNSGSGKVEDNANLNGHLPAKYAFNKCMARMGIPLS